jgi:PPM family protein phosphatase
VTDETMRPSGRGGNLKLKYAGMSHVGMKRTHNEDAFRMLPEESLYMVADGMGGHASGEVASQMAVETIESFFKMTTRDEEVTWPFKEEKNLRYDENRLVAGIKFSNQRIFEAAAREARFKGMGTTIVTAFFTQGGAYLGHVGDSRGYRIRDGRIEQITDDHSLLNDYIKANKLTPEEIEHFPHKNVIVRALGMKETVQVDVNRLDPKPNDYYLLCSDGLSGMIDDNKILELVTTSRDLETACEAMITAANAAGGTDNITVALIQFVSE